MPSESAPLPSPAATLQRPPGELARETLRLLASRRIAPTPENYARVYGEIAGTAVAPSPAAAPGQPDTADWAQLIRELLRQLELRHAGISLTQKRDGLERLLINARRSPQLGEKLAAMMRAWGEVQPAPPGIVVIEAQDAAAGGDPRAGGAGLARPAAAAAAAVGDPGVTVLPIVADLAHSLRNLLATVFEREVGPRVSGWPKLVRAVDRLPALVRAASTPADCAAIDAAIVALARDAELVQVEQQQIVEDAMALVRMLVANLGELVDDDRWVTGQVALLGRTVAQPPSSRTLADAQAQFRETAERQRVLRQSLRELKRTLKELIGVFVQRVGEMARSAVDYQSKIGRYASRVRNTDNVDSLRDLLDDLSEDIRLMQVDATRSRDDVVGVSAQAEQARAKVAELEAELERVSAALREDALTGALNRRGLDEAIERETARALRYRADLCLSVIDLDNFKLLNDRLGHQAGDDALRHLVEAVKPMLRPSDSIGRLGGEEFVLVLPETPVEDARTVVERLQRELTRRFFLHNNEKVLITFSAGVAQLGPAETGEALLQRADAAMYEAKQQGRNRVLVA